jgi:hypothetical protein
MTRRPSLRAPAVCGVVASVTRKPSMSHRHWFVILTTDEGEYRSGPYPSRTSAERKARERHRHAPTGAVKVVYDPELSASRSRR